MSSAPSTHEFAGPPRRYPITYDTTTRRDVLRFEEGLAKWFVASPLLPFKEPFVSAEDEVAGEIRSLVRLEKGWDGDGAPAPDRQSVQNALEFWELAGLFGVDRPAVGPANDGGVVFEWELSAGRSVYCYARPDGVEVAAFDSERDYIDIKLAAFAAASIAAQIMLATSWW